MDKLGDIEVMADERSSRGIAMLTIVHTIQCVY